MVAHDPQLAGRHLHRGELAPGASRAVLIDVRLIEGLVVNRHPALGIAAGHRVTSHADDPFDEVLVAGGTEAEHTLNRTHGTGDNVARRVDQGLRPLEAGAVAVEHDNLTAVDVPEAVDELVDQNPVVDQQGPFHRDGRYPERLHEKCLDDQCEQEGDQYEDRQLTGERAPPPAAAAQCPARAPGGFLGDRIHRDRLGFAKGAPGDGSIPGDRGLGARHRAGRVSRRDHGVFPSIIARDGSRKVSRAGAGVAAPLHRLPIRHLPTAIIRRPLATGRV